MKFILRIYRFIILFKYYKSITVALFLSKFPGNHSFLKNNNVIYNPKNKTFEFKDTISYLNFEDIQLLGGHWNSILHLASIFSFKRIDDKLIMSTNVNGKTINFFADSSDIAFAASEIFVEKLYDFTEKNQYEFIDIGMNRGLASLFLASFINVKTVYSFEPFKDTFDLAERNFSLNPDLRKKIVSNSFGWSRKNEILEIKLKKPGFLGASTTNSEILSYKCGNDVRIENRRASEILKSLIQNIPKNMKIGIKMDCEGAEYGIIEDLFDSGLLALISIVMIEWHSLGKIDLLEKLQKSGFSVFCPERIYDTETSMGMIYGFNYMS